MELVNLMYRYINKFLNSKDLLKELKNLDLTNFSEDKKGKIEELMNNLEDIIKSVPNEFDEYEKKRLESLDKFIGSMEKTLKSGCLDKEVEEFLNKKLKSLNEEKTLERDGGKLYENVFTLMTQNEVVGKYKRSMNTKELLDFIAQYILVPFPLPIDQKEFDDLVEAGIEDDKREYIWRLGVNYNYKGFDYSKIVDYFIKVKDAYYIQELLSACSESVDKFEAAKKVLKTKDKEFMLDVEKRCLECGIITEEEKLKILEDN